VNGLQVLRRLRAFAEGRPLPLGSTRRVSVADDAESLVLTFVRMGGESAPWGLAWGHPGEKPHVLTVAEPRNRDLVADAIAKFAPDFLRHVLCPDLVPCPLDSDGKPAMPLPRRQVWVANPTHVEMFHMLEYAYAFTKFGDPERARTLRALGRAMGFTFREAQRPGQTLVLVATEALRQCYTFPCEDTRQGHLGYLLGWLATHGSLEERQATAEAAEERPISTSLDPQFESKVMEPLVTRFNEARAAGAPGAIAAAKAEVEAALRPELEYRFELTVEAARRLRADARRANDGLALLEKASRDEHWYQYLRQELDKDDAQDGPAFRISPETDRYAAAAASRFYVHEASAELWRAALLADDEEMIQEALADGDAARGRIDEVLCQIVKKQTKQRRWRVVVDSELPTRFREGGTLRVAEHPGREVQLLAMEALEGGGTSMLVEVTKAKTAKNGLLAGEDPKLRGETVTLLRVSDGSISRSKGWSVWQKDGPGAWLTHSRPTSLRARLPEEVEDDVDAIRQKLGVDQ
jgi:hypothetical protein